MNSNGCILNIIINYNGKQFNKKLANRVSLEEIKILSIKYFNISNEDINFIKFTTLSSYNNKNTIYIKSDNDIYYHMKEIDEEHYEIKINLLIERAKNFSKIPSMSSSEISALNRTYETNKELFNNLTKIKDNKEREESYIKIIHLFRDKYKKYKEMYIKLISQKEYIENINKILSEKNKNLEMENAKLTKKMEELEEKCRTLEKENLNLKKEIKKNEIFLEKNKIKQYFGENKKFIEEVIGLSLNKYNENIGEKIINQYKDVVYSQIKSEIKEEFTKEKENEKLTNNPNIEILNEIKKIKEMLELQNKKEKNT